MHDFANAVNFRCVCFLFKPAYHFLIVARWTSLKDIPDRPQRAHGTQFLFPHGRVFVDDECLFLGVGDCWLSVDSQNIYTCKPRVAININQ